MTKGTECMLLEPQALKRKRLECIMHSTFIYPKMVNRTTSVRLKTTIYGFKINKPEVLCFEISTSLNREKAENGEEAGRCT